MQAKNPLEPLQTKTLGNKSNSQATLVDKNNTYHNPQSSAIDNQNEDDFINIEVANTKLNRVVES